MSKRPLILISNDDGFTAPGIQFLVKCAEEFGDLMIVAPDKPQSGMGHAITVNSPLRLTQTDYFGDHKAYYANGTPVDCIKLGLFECRDRKPDLVISGINHGSNVATNVLYSGTMSAAVEGAIAGIPSIGFSLCDYSWKADFNPCEKYIKSLISNVIRDGLKKGVCLNVNIPKLDGSEIKGMRICRQAKAFWDDSFDKRTDPLGKDYYWLAGSFENHEQKEGADMYALDNGYVTVVPVQFDMTDYELVDGLKKWEL